MAEIETSEVSVDAILDPQDISVSIEDVIVIKGQDADIAAAEAATSAANEAATNANNATLNANEATENANNAASNATEAAINANNAAKNANEAASNAKNATTNANNAADNANNAATQVTAQYAEDKQAWDAEVSAAAGEARAAGAEVKADYEQNVVTDYERRTAEWQSQLDEKATKDELAATIHEQEATDLMQDKRIENLEAAANGVLYREETDTSEAYSKDVPAGAMPWASLDKVGGKTVVWNQLERPKKFNYSRTEFSASASSSNIIEVVANSDIDTSFGDNVFSSNAAFIAEHKFFVDAPVYLELYFKAQGIQVYPGGRIFTATVTSAYSNISFAFNKCKAGTYRFLFCVHDLTIMFGAGNEPTSIDDPRIAFIKAYAEEHPEYNPGELMSAEVVEVESRGKNLLNIHCNTLKTGPIQSTSKRNLDGNGVWIGMTMNNYLSPENIEHYAVLDDTVEVRTRSSGYGVGYEIACEPNTIYSFTRGVDAASTIGIGYYDSEGALIGWLIDYASINVLTFTTPSNCEYIMFVFRPPISELTKYVRPQLEKGSKRTEYSPYGTKDTFPIPDEVREMCPGYGWSAGTVCNEIDFERKVYVQRVGSVDLSTLDLHIGKASNIDEGYFGYYLKVSDSFPQMKPGINVVCKRFFYHPQTIYWEDMPADSFFSNEYLHFQAKYNKIPDFKAAMQGEMLYYELAEPVEVDLSDVLPDDHYIEVEAGGTITFKQASTQLPVPSSVTYQISTKEAIANA